MNRAWLTRFEATDRLAMATLAWCVLAPVFLLAPARLFSQPCPDLVPDSGYPVAATSPSEVVDTTWLRAVAGAAAYRWRVPSSRRDRYRGWDRVASRILPPEPLWAEDWKPRSHTASLRLVLFRDGRDPRVELLAGSGDRTFDRSLATIADEPMPGSPPFPLLPPGPFDSVALTLRFGELDPAEPHGMVRFAAVQTRAELERNSLRVTPPPGHSGRVPRTTVRYDVMENGRVDLASIEFLTATTGAVQNAIIDGLRGARFRPPTANCRPIAQTVVQTFGG